MATTKQQRFRITPWPGTPLPPARVDAFPAVVVGSEIVYDLDEWRPVVLPEELVIREVLELDLDNPELVAAFVSEHGAITRPLDMGEIPSWERPQLSRLEVGVIADWLRRAAVLADHYVEHMRDGDVVQAWTRRYAEVGVQDEAGAWKAFSSFFRTGLAAFHARVDVLRGDELQFGRPTPDLFEALCLQLHQLILSELPVLECANETCPRLFVRQRGTATHGQYRTMGVAYCSRACAKAQIQREYRRRKREETQR